MNWFTRLRSEVNASVKMLEIEERYDLAFSRPFGLAFAKLGARLHMTPTQVSILSLVIGSGGGFLLVRSDIYALVVIACVAIVIAGLLDSADGQLARLTNQSSEIGRIIDGIVDNTVFVTFYFCAIFYMAPEYGTWYMVLLGAIGGGAHSWKSSVYELHKAEFQLYVGGYKDSRLPTPDEVRETFVRDTLFKKFVYVVYLDYCKKQQNSGFRKQAVRKEFENLAFTDEARDKFVSLYRKANLDMLYWWAWVGGTNVQRAGIIISLLFMRFDIYLMINGLSLIPFYIIGKMQARKDREILEAFDETT